MLLRFDLMQDFGPFDDGNRDRRDRLGGQEPASKAGIVMIVRMRLDTAMTMNSARFGRIGLGPRCGLPRNGLLLVATVPGSGMVVQRMDEARRQKIGEQRGDDPNALSRNHYPDSGPDVTEISHPYYAPVPGKWEV